MRLNAPQIGGDIGGGKADTELFHGTAIVGLIGELQGVRSHLAIALHRDRKESADEAGRSVEDIAWQETKPGGETPLKH